MSGQSWAPNIKMVVSHYQVCFISNKDSLILQAHLNRLCYGSLWRKQQIQKASLFCAVTTFCNVILNIDFMQKARIPREWG